MKVWIVLDHDERENPQVVAVYASEAEARKHATIAGAADRYGDDAFTVWENEVKDAFSGLPNEIRFQPYPQENQF